MNKTINILAIAFFFLLIGCANKDLNQNNLNALELFNQGLSDMKLGKYNKAKKSFSLINQEFPYAKEAQKSQYYEGYLEYKLKKYDLASIALDEYTQLYPAGEDIESAYYLKAMTYYDQIIEVRLDQGVAEKALEAFQQLIARFPNGQFEMDAKLKIELILDQLAGKEMNIAKYYLKRGVIPAAINRYQNIVKKYSTTCYIEEALYRLVESNIYLGIESEAMKYASILGNNYPSGNWYKKAYSLIKQNVK